MTNRFKQQLGGAVLALLGGEFTVWTWYHGPDEDPHFHKACVLFPAVFVVGIALILFPDYEAERRGSGQDTSSLRGWRLLTPRWWVVIVVGLALGFANDFYLAKLP